MLWLTIGTWLLTALNLVGTVLNVKKVKYCFYIWLLANAFWLAYDVYVGLYSRAVLDAVHFGLAAWGIIAWKNNKNNLKEDK